MANVVKTLVKELCTHADLCLAMATGAAVYAQFIMCNIFGTLAITASYKKRDLHTDEAQSHLSLIFLLANSLSCI